MGTVLPQDANQAVTFTVTAPINGLTTVSNIFTGPVIQASMNSAVIAGSSAGFFESASCSFFQNQGPDDSDGQVTCDLDSKLADVFSGDGSDVSLFAPAICVFCSFDLASAQ
jgi:hypothetical protein